jgi:hypothetical protein
MSWLDIRNQRQAAQAYDAVYAKAVLAHAGGDSLKFLCLTSTEPSLNALSHLPGATPEAKVGYFLDWLMAGLSVYLTAWDMIGATHDSAGLRGCTPVRNGVKIEDPAAAAEAAFPDGGDPDWGTYHLLRKAVAENPNCADAKFAIFQKRAAAA